MMLLGSHHKERYEQMKMEVNRREIEWWLYRSNNKYISDDLKSIIEMLKNDFVEIGPFGTSFVGGNKKRLVDNFYGIPLRHSFSNDRRTETEGIAYAATNGDSSILLSNIFEYLRNSSGESEFRGLELTAICVQLATNHDGQRLVVAMDCIEKLKPMAFYEHPPNGRLFQAMTGIDIPEHSVLTMTGERRKRHKPHLEVFMEASNLYADYELGNITQQCLSTQLYSFFENKNEHTDC